MKHQEILSNSGGAKDCWGTNTEAEGPKLQVMLVYTRKGDQEVLTLRVKPSQGMMLHVRKGQTQPLSPPWVRMRGERTAVRRDEVSQQTQRQL